MLLKLNLPPRNIVALSVKRRLYSALCPDKPKKLPSDEFVSKLLDLKWAMRSPGAEIHQVMVSEKGERCSFWNNREPALGERISGKKAGQQSFYVVRDDLLHPLANGNKARKLDALLPLLEYNSVTDVVTCVGCQSAHAAAVAVSCAERGLKAHLLLRGEQPETLTGYALISSLYGNVTYVERSDYAKREEMLLRHASSIAGSDGYVESLNDLLEMAFLNRIQSDVSQEIKKKKKVVIINEGAADVVALLGVMRLVEHLSQEHLFGKDQAIRIVLDAGTGTTAVGLGLGAMCLGLPWEIHAVMLADTINGYREKEEGLISEFQRISSSQLINERKVVHWVERRSPRKFGNVMKGEVEECQRIAQQTGILVDPVYTLAGWELAAEFCLNKGKNCNVVMLHTRGTLGMFGLAQRYNKSYFQNLR